MSKVYLVAPHIHSGELSRRASASTPTRFLLSCNRPLAILVCPTQGKSAVGPAEHRLTLSNRPSSTSCFLSALNTSFTSLGEYIDAAIISFRPNNRTRRFSLATSRCQTPVDTSDPAPSVPFHHSAILASLAYTSSTRGGCRRWVWVWGGSNPLLLPKLKPPKFLLKNEKKREKRSPRRGSEGGKGGKGVTPPPKPKPPPIFHFFIFFIFF